MSGSGSSGLVDPSGMPIASPPRLFFSILVPGRNARPFVEPCLRSVQAQTFPSWECLVTDDASDDGTWEEIQRVVAGDLRFRLFRGSERQTALPRLMEMIRQARGDYVFILDLDDWLPGPHVLDYVFRVYEDAPSVVATSGSYMRYPDGGRGHTRPVPEGADWFSGWWFGHPLTFLRSLSLESFAQEPEAYIDITTGKPFTITYDLALFFPIAARAEWYGRQIAHIGEILYVYSRGPQNDDATPEGLQRQTAAATQISLAWQNRMMRSFNQAQR